MKLTPSRMGSRVALTLGSLVSLASSLAMAQEEAPPEKAAPTPASNAPPPGSSPSGGIERMPAEAFWPAPYLRGLEGGSVWLNPVHGLQWPYYRRTGIGFSGDVWVDTAYERINRGDTNQPKDRAWIQQGRFTLRATPTYTTHDDWFVQGQAEFIANKDQTLKQPDVADTDDLWVAIGQWNKWEIKLGRYQGWEVFHLGMGLDLNTFERRGATDTAHPPPDIYGVTNAYYRPSGVGNVGAHLYFTDSLRLELLGQLGSEQGQNSLGGRGVAVFDKGWVKLKAGGEYKKTTQVDPNLPQNTDPRGFGAGVIFVVDPWVEFGFSAARELVDRIDERRNTDAGGSFTQNSFGGFANLRPLAHGSLHDLLLGGGYFRTKKTDLRVNTTTGANGNFEHVQMFAAIQYLIIKQLYVKLVLAKADAKLSPYDSPAYANHMYSARLRVYYLF